MNPNYLWRGLLSGLLVTLNFISGERVTGSWHEYSSKMTMVVIVATPFITAWASYCVLTMNFQFSFLITRKQTVNNFTYVNGKPKRLGKFFL